MQCVLCQYPQALWQNCRSVTQQDGQCVTDKNADLPYLQNLVILTLWEKLTHTGVTPGDFSLDLVMSGLT